MRFSISRLCGGKALMLSSASDLRIDMDSAMSVISCIGDVREHDEMMIVFLWNGMEVTFYPQGRIMFHPLEDADTAVGYATDILGKIVEARDA